MADTDSSPSIAGKPESLSFAEFLENVPSNRPALVANLAKTHPVTPSLFALTTPQIQLHCNSDACNGVRFFGHQWRVAEIKDILSYHFLAYACRNCGLKSKVYAIGARITKNLDGEAFKFGEFPPFGPVTPPRLIKLIGPDRDLFLMSGRAENQRLGIGAFCLLQTRSRKSKV